MGRNNKKYKEASQGKRYIYGRVVTALINKEGGRPEAPENEALIGLLFHPMEAISIPVYRDVDEGILI